MRDKVGFIVIFQLWLYYRDKLKYQLCKDHGIEIIYYFPEEFLKYNIEFYKDKKCFHNIDDLKKYLETL